MFLININLGLTPMYSRKRILGLKRPKNKNLFFFFLFFLLAKCYITNIIALECTLLSLPAEGTIGQGGVLLLINYPRKAMGPPP